MAKPQHTRIGVGTSQAGRARAQHASGSSADTARLSPATRSLREVLAERGPLTGPITDAGTRALLTVRGEQPDGGHGES